MSYRKAPSVSRPQLASSSRARLGPGWHDWPFREGARRTPAWRSLAIANRARIKSCAALGSRQLRPVPPRPRCGRRPVFVTSPYARYMVEPNLVRCGWTPRSVAGRSLASVRALRAQTRRPKTQREWLRATAASTHERYPHHKCRGLQARSNLARAVPLNCLSANTNRAPLFSPFS